MESAAGEMGSVSNTNVCDCAYGRVASAEMCEHRRCTAGRVHIYMEMPCRNVGTCLLGVPSASEGMKGVYGVTYLSGSGCVPVHLIHDGRRVHLGTVGAEGVTLKEIFLMIAIV